jgi:hypothetical protein
MQMAENKITRRFFIGGASAFGAFSGCRFFSAGSDFSLGDKPRLRFGVASDVHICFGRNIDYFKKMLEDFRDREVDAVMICGDIVDLGMVSDLELIASTWESVFPGNRAPDGRHVEKIFVTGNHDWVGHTYGNRAKKLYANQEDFAKNILCSDIKSHWQRIFNEPFSPVYMKDVKGYKFVGAHWVKNDCNGKCENFNDEIKSFYASHAQDFDPSLPFFHAQHPHPKNSCYGPWAWGRDNGVTTEILSKYPNAVAFSGHSHYSLTDERSIWQGAFTSIGTSSLSYTGLMIDKYPGEYENGPKPKNKVRFMRGFDTIDGKQAMIVSVYDDKIVINRREYFTGQSLGDDWVMPLPAAESKPFAYAKRAKTQRAPEFPPNSKVVASKVKHLVKLSKDDKGRYEDAYTVKFPAAESSSSLRAREYTVTFTGSDGNKVMRRILSPAFHLPITNPIAKADVDCIFVSSMLPKAPLKVEVRPLSCFEKAGRAISTVIA